MNDLFGFKVCLFWILYYSAFLYKCLLNDLMNLYYIIKVILELNIFLQNFNRNAKLYVKFSQMTKRFFLLKTDCLLICLPHYVISSLTMLFTFASSTQCNARSVSRCSKNNRRKIWNRTSWDHFLHLKFWMHSLFSSTKAGP